MTHRIVAIIQARMSSSRLPGKVLCEIAGQAMLNLVYKRSSLAVNLQEVMVATSTDTSDDVLEEYCKGSDIPCIRGSQFDVLDRYYSAARWAKADIVVRLTADCPLIDPSLIDGTVRILIGGSDGRRDAVTQPRSTDFDFVANRLPPPWKRTYPIGLDTEVCTFQALEQAWSESKSPQEREHVMPYLYEDVHLTLKRSQLSSGTSPRGFRIALLDHSVDYGWYRWTVDTAEDLVFVREVYRYFGGRMDFSWMDVLDLVHAQPHLMEINAGVKHKTLRDVDERASGK